MVRQTLERLVKRAGQPYRIVRGGAAAAQDTMGFLTNEKGSGRRFLGFLPGVDLKSGDEVEGRLTGERFYVTEIGADVADGEVVLVKGYCLSQAERDRETAMSASGDVPATGPDPRGVFVVYGRNVAVRDEMYAFLRALDLRPIEFDSAVRATGEGSPTIDRILDQAFALAQAVVVLLTGDDEGRLRPRFLQRHDPEHERELTPQPRGNVLFEAGMAFGRNPERSILVQCGDVLRPFSDISGRYALRFTGSAPDRSRLKERLKTAGCAVDDSGAYWYTAGDFARALREPDPPAGTAPGA